MAWEAEPTVSPLARSFEKPRSIRPARAPRSHASSPSRAERCSSSRAVSSSTCSGVGRSTAGSGSPNGADGWSSSRSDGTRAAFPAASPTRTTTCGQFKRRRRSCSTSAVSGGQEATATAQSALPGAQVARPTAAARAGRGQPRRVEGEHPLTVARALGNRQVFLAGWRPHHELPEALNAADLLVLPSVAEAFGLSS